MRRPSLFAAITGLTITLLLTVSAPTLAVAGVPITAKERFGLVDLSDQRPARSTEPAVRGPGPLCARRPSTDAPVGDSSNAACRFRPVQERASLSAPTLEAASTPKWRSYPMYGGEMTSIVADPTNPQIVYVGTRDAGVFKTTDGGQFWQPAREGLTVMPIRVLRVDPQRPNILYAGADFDEIWKSINSGESWFKSSNGMADVVIINDIAIDPRNPDVVYAAIGDGHNGVPLGNIYKSGNGGATWQIKDNGIPRDQAYPSYTHWAMTRVTVNPNNSAILYVGNYWDLGVYTSTNAGETWTAMNNCFPFTPYANPVNALVIDPHQNRLSADIGNGSLGGYYVYVNNCWKQICSGNEYQNAWLIEGSLLYFHPANPSIIKLGKPPA